MPTAYFTKILKNIIIVIVFLGLLRLYLFYFERKSIFYPTKRIDFTPDVIGLKYEDLYFRTNGGVRLNGWWIPARNPRATLLFCHGNAGNIGDRMEFIGLFNEMNLDLFIFDYRGFGKSAGRPNESGTYLDAVSAYNYVRSNKDVPEDKIILFGKSIGGNVAIDLATKVNAALLISDSAFTSTVAMGRQVYPFLPVKLIITQRYDALSKIGKIDLPKLIIHSKEDEIVPFHHGEELYAAADVPKEFFVTEGSHNEAIFTHRTKYKEGLESFLAKYLR